VGPALQHTRADRLLPWRLARARRASYCHGSNDEDAAWQLLKQRDDKRYSFTDCTSFAVMRRMGLHRAATLDQEPSGATRACYPPSCASSA